MVAIPHWNGFHALSGIPIGNDHHAIVGPTAGHAGPDVSIMAFHQRPRTTDAHLPRNDDIVGSRAATQTFFAREPTTIIAGMRLGEEPASVADVYGLGTGVEVGAMPSRVSGAVESGVSRIGLGLAALGRPGYINLGHAADLPAGHDVAAMEAHAHEVLDVAWAGGVRYFDAARSYGRAEDFLASWLRRRDLPPSDVVVGSKWGYVYTGGWRTDADVNEVKDLSLATLRRQIGESRERLGEYLDLYQVHSATLESGVLDNVAVLDELARLRESGLRVGLSVSGARQGDTVRRALEVERDGQRLFSTVQATWNLLERSAEAALEEAHQAGVLVIVKEALANGALTERNDDPAVAPRLDVLRAEGARYGAGMDAVALAAAMANPWAGVVLSGAATAAQLRSNLRALACPWDDASEARLGALALDPREYWARRGRLPWT